MMFVKSLIKSGIILILALFLIASFAFALSEVYVNQPTTGQNVSGNITLIATTNASAVNVTYRWQNSTGQFVLNFTIYNDTYPDTDFTNTTFDTTQLPDGVYNLTVNATNKTDTTVGNATVTDITIDNTLPAVTTFNTPISGNYYNASFVLNVTVTDLLPFAVQYRFENGSDPNHIVVNWTSMSNPGGNFWNATINVTAIADWNYTIRINATDIVNNSNTTETIVVGIDDTSPTITIFSCDNIVVGASQSCTCTATDNSQSFGGGVSTSISSADTSVVTTHTVTCTATDTASNTNTNTTSYTVSTDPTSYGGSSGGGGPKGAAGGITSGITGQFQKKEWGSLGEGETANVEIEDDSLGITTVQFAVEKETRRPWIKIERFDMLPNDMKYFSGKRYKNIRITEKDIQNFLRGKAIIYFKVKKSWLVENELPKDRIALFRYHNNNWNELKTTVDKEDGVYIHYSAETPGFSYFLIGEKIHSSRIEGGFKEKSISHLVKQALEKEIDQIQKITTPLKKTNFRSVLILLIFVIAIVAIVVSLRKTKREYKYSNIGSFIRKLRK